MNRTLLAVVLQLVGILVAACGVWMQWPWLGVCVFGAGLLAVGVELEREHSVEPDGDA